MACPRQSPIRRVDCMLVAGNRAAKFVTVSSPPIGPGEVTK